jgi:hypothetical protein
MMRLLRPTASLSLLRSRTGLAILASRATHALHPRSGIFLRSFRLHSVHYARERIAKICSLCVALATAIISQTGSWRLRTCS